MQAVCDVPTAAFIPELFEAYPEAKVVIIERDVEKWYNSCKQTVQNLEGSSLASVLQYLDPYLLRRFLPMMSLMMTSLFGPVGQSPEQKEASWCNTYRNIYKEARQVVPNDQLLEFKLEQGWEPLCNFLGNDVPPTPFPHINETASFKAKMSVLKKLTIRRIFRSSIPIMVIGAAVQLILYAFRK